MNYLRFLFFKRLYCKHSTEVFDTPEKELKYFLKRMKLPGWKWPLSKTPIPPEYAVYLAQNRSAFDKDRYYCKLLVR